MRYISREMLEKAIKKYFKGLVSKGKHIVDLYDFNAELHKIIKELPQETAIEWNSVEKVGLPLVSDEYLVMIVYADKPTVLCFDAEDGVFFEERIDLDEDVTYKVTHWAEMPGAPEE